MEQQPKDSGLMGRWLKERCEQKGWSLREAASETGLSHATIRDIINGVQPSAESIKKLTTAFGGNGHRMLALEDQLLTLAGYRTEREKIELSESMGLLIDRLTTLSETQLKMVGRFADFLAAMEQK